MAPLDGDDPYLHEGALQRAAGCGRRALPLGRREPAAVAVRARRVPGPQPRVRAGDGAVLPWDPNAAALNLIEASSYHGRGLSAIVAAFSMEDMYGDGANLYQYLGSNPWQRHDPLGTSWDPFDMVDEFMAEHSASVAAWMNEIGHGLNGAGMIAATVVSYLPLPGAALVGDIAAAILNGEDLSDVLMGHALGLSPAASWSGSSGAWP
jgi:hypothetical protein